MPVFSSRSSRREFGVRLRLESVGHTGRTVDSVTRDEILKTGDVKSLGLWSEPWVMRETRAQRTGCQGKTPYCHLSVACPYLYRTCLSWS